MQTYKMFINGEWVDTESGKTFATINPSTGEELGRVPQAGIEDVDKAVNAANQALPEWSKMTQSDRAKTILRFADLVEEHSEELVDLEVNEHGTPIMLARGFAAAAVDQLEYIACISRGLMGQVLPQSIPNTIGYLQRVPIGVCAVITPWNVPLMMMLSMIGPALVTGNTCILKPASVSSILGVKFTEILEKADLPRGVMNLVTGPGGSVGDALTTHPGVDMVRFTGASDTGKEILMAASQTVKKCVMELGGNNPVIVCEDANVEKAAKLQAGRHYGNSAQNCSTPGRYYVHENVYDEFVEVFANEVKGINVGLPWDEKTAMGPMASLQQLEKVEYYIKTAKEQGARIVCGGSRPSTPPLDKGHFLMPTVVADCTHDMTIVREEIFGPAACILKFSSEEEVVKLANDSEYGLCAGVWTENGSKAMKITDELRVDSVFINMPRMMTPEFPWGGNVRQSGVGKSDSVCGMEEFTDLKFICKSYS
ncbi:MAG: aldehyde dehydrogenase [Deltaproteobacteria bacterium]|nr:aldehyde dehydrogenase [Deltaproteobacteria bacterium]